MVAKPYKLCHYTYMKRPEYIAGAIYDVDDTLLDNQPDGNDPLSNLHQIARLEAIRALAAQDNITYAQLLDVTPQENFDCFTESPVHTVAGAFYTLLKNRGLLTGDVDPTNPIILELIALKNKSYGLALAEYGKPIKGADDFVRDLASQYDIENKNAIASTAILLDIQAFLDKYDLAYLFPDERIIDVSRVTRPKPDPEAFDTAFRRLDLPETARGNVVAFEDDPRGMLSARKAGLYVCGITTRYPREFLADIEAKPDVIADSYAEFREYFELS